MPYTIVLKYCCLLYILCTVLEYSLSVAIVVTIKQKKNSLGVAPLQNVGKLKSGGKTKQTTVQTVSTATLIGSGPTIPETKHTQKKGRTRKVRTTKYRTE